MRDVTSKHPIKFADLVDVDSLQVLMDGFQQVIGIANAIIDVDGVVITSSGWQDVCVKFHRVNSVTCARCIESDTSLVGSMLKGAPFAVYGCLNGLVDSAAPIVVDGQHVANIFTGQFFTSLPDLEFFRKQAKAFGFDEIQYLAAVSRVPIVPKERVEAITKLYANIANVFAANGFDRLRQQQSESELTQLNQSLARLVQERTAELTEKNRRLLAEEEALRVSEAKLHTLLNNAPVGIWMVGADGRYHFVNKTFCNAVGIPESAFLATTHLPDLLGEEMAASCQASDRASLAQDEPHLSYETIPFVDGKKHLLEITKVKLNDDAGKGVASIGIAIDVTERKQAEDRLQQQLSFSRALNKVAETIVSHDRPEPILEDAANIIGETLGADRALIYNLDFANQLAIGLSEYLNPLYPEITPTKATYPLEVFIGGTSEIRRTRHWLTSHASEINPHLMQDGSGEVLHRQMNIRSLLWYPVAFRDDGYHLLVLNQIHAHREWTKEEFEFLDSVSRQVSIALGKMRMVEERKRADERIKYLANFDALTALPNRSQLDERINYLLSLAKRGSGELAVMFLDLDHFKNVNETLGHSVGDALLVEVAKRLTACVRDGDTVSRFGGDEFILLLPISEVKTVSHVADKLLHAIGNSCQVGNIEINITPSIGIALYPGDGGDFETLASNADAALFRAKQEGRNCYRFFAAEMQSRSSRMLQLGNAMRHALERNEMELHYQPQIMLHDGSVVGAEALLRWRHRELGNVSPAEFIPVAEDNGMILPIGEWVLRSAVQQARRWLDMGLPPMVIAVNLSAVQFRHPGLPQLVARILEEAQLPPEYLELELTEGVAMHDPRAAIAMMNELHDCGVRMSIDDFGTGYSSLSYLKKFKVYKLKIDQSFVRDISTDHEDKAIVSAVINMAESLGLQTIAEGVETAGQLAYLHAQGCNEVQGYHFSKPLPVEQFETWVRNHRQSLR